MDQGVLGIFVILAIAVVGFVIFWLGFDTVQEPDHGWVSILGRKKYHVKPGWVWVPPLIGRLFTASFAIYYPKVDVQNSQSAGEFPVNFSTEITIQVQLEHKVDAEGHFIADPTSLLLFFNNFRSMKDALKALENTIRGEVELFIRSRTPEQLRGGKPVRDLKRVLETRLDAWGKGCGLNVQRVNVGQLTSPFIVQQSEEILKAQTRLEVQRLRGQALVSEVEAIQASKLLPPNLKAFLIKAVGLQRAVQDTPTTIVAGGGPSVIDTLMGAVVGKFNDAIVKKGKKE